MIKISESVAQQLSEEWKSLPISVNEAQFKHFELLPVYLREHIWLRVQKHFKASMRPAHEHWIQWEHAQLRKKWEDFLELAAQRIQVPREDVIKLGQDFVHTWVPILVEPSKYLVHWFYGDKVEMQVKQIEARCEELLFFPELKNLIPRYLHRKDLHVLSKVRASQIIQQLHTKLFEKFDWDRWGQELETFYQVCCRSDIPSDWLVTYFDDRGLREWSQHLPAVNLTVNQLLDVLKPLDTQIGDLIEDKQTEEETKSIVLVAEEINEEEDSLHPDSLASLYMKGESHSSQTVDLTIDEANLGDDESLFNYPIKKDNTEESENTHLSSASLGDSSISSGINEENAQMLLQVESEAEPLNTPTQEKEDEELENRLAQALKKNRRKYIKKLFKGSKEDYLDVLETLESKYIWPKVVSCLQKDIIPNYDIDMTTKTMVQFTDELEKYFND
ncbi:MAG: hypothetical protein VX062_05850 [Bacteroidota bacterium]|nr:hypothetical protein [Bacteroidota bacterium]